MTLDSDVFVAPLTGDMDMTRLVIAAILCALLGLFTLRAQRPNTWQFVLTIAGLIGVT